MEILQSVKNGKRRDGQMLLIKHLNGGTLSHKQAIRAKCYDCDGMGDSGKCEISTCSLYPFSQFKAEKELLAN
jgi:hypothetical protein